MICTLKRGRISVCARAASDRSNITDAIGVEWFQKVFLRHCGTDQPQLLILDSHSSHEVIDLLQTAREENIHIYAFPPHTTHLLQPLDKVVFAPLEPFYSYGI